MLRNLINLIFESDLNDVTYDLHGEPTDDQIEDEAEFAKANWLRITSNQILFHEVMEKLNGWLSAYDAGSYEDVGNGETGIPAVDRAVRMRNQLQREANFKHD